MDDQFFDEQTAKNWIETIEDSSKSFRDDYVYPRINKLIYSTQADTIVDLGCGQGICSENIDLNHSKYMGVDPSLFLIDRAMELYKDSDRSFLNGNIYDLPIPDGKFNIAFTVMVWHLLENIEKASLEMSRVLTKGGSFLIVTANPEAYSIWKSFYPDAILNGKKLEGTMTIGDKTSSDVLFLHSFDEIKKSLHSAKLEIQYTETFLKAGKSSELDLLILIEGTKLTG